MLKTKKTYLSILIILISIFVLEFLNSTKPKHPHADLGIEQLTEKFGYPLEAHQVTTEDGYILTLHRIPHGRSKTQKKGIPILFMHGFSQTSTDYVVLGPGKALSLILADQGYDVWLGNARGNTWGRKHINLDPNNDWKFWDYSVHEIGYYDLPASIDYVLNSTKEAQLHYVGFSQGTIIYFVLMSERPQYAQKIRLMSALAPSIFLENPQPIALKLGIFFRKLIQIFLVDILYPHEVLPINGPVSTYLKQICNENSIFVNLCELHIALIHGFNPAGQNHTIFSLVFSNMPAGVSSKQLVHVLQLMESGNFHQFDLGISGNLKEYGQETPPIYDLSRATAPVALYYASNDVTINVKNMEKIKQRVPNVVKSYQVPSATYDHNDFVYNHKSEELLYRSVIEEIDKY